MLIDTSIPLPLAVWLIHDDYDYGTDPYYMSATQLLQPTRSIVLSKRVPEPEEIDLSRLIAPKLGNAIHDSIEAIWKVPAYREAAMLKLGYPEKIVNNLDVHIEERSKRKFKNYTIGGKFDMVINGNLFDFKSTSVYTWINQDKLNDYQLQGSIYRWLNPNLIESDDITICYIFTDWSAKEAAYKEGYPNQRIKQQAIPLLSFAEVERFLDRKIKEVENNDALDQNAMVRCSDEELWRSQPKFKYYASGDTTKRATRVFDTANEAAAFKAGNKSKGTIMMVPGSPKRCNYCYAAPICEQRREMLGGESD